MSICTYEFGGYNIEHFALLPTEELRNMLISRKIEYDLDKIHNHNDGMYVVFLRLSPKIYSDDMKYVIDRTELFRKFFFGKSMVDITEQIKQEFKELESTIWFNRYLQT